jgi:hypothetical protein
VPLAAKPATQPAEPAATLPAGRYAVYPGERPRPMPSVAAALYPDRVQEFIPVRRGGVGIQCFQVFLIIKAH